MRRYALPIAPLYQFLDSRGISKSSPPYDHRLINKPIRGGLLKVA